MKIGIYGGSFNPPHLGHQNAAVEAAEKCALDKLLLIPAGIPPHKVMEQGSPANEHRLAMTRLMGGQAALQSGVPAFCRSRMAVSSRKRSCAVSF